MKKQILTAVCLTSLMATGSAFAATTSIGGISLNIPTATKSTTNTATNANVAKLKSQVTALQTKMNATSSQYETVVEDLVTNLLPANEAKAFKEKAQAVKSSAKPGSGVTIDVAEDGTVELNKALKSSDLSYLKNLSSTKRAALKKDLGVLNNVKNSYISIGKDATALASTIKADPSAALASTSELLQLAKTGKETASQVKNITKLSTNLTSALAKSGISLK